MSDPPNRTSLRTRRIPSRPDEVVSLAPRARATLTPEGSAPPEPVVPIQAVLSHHFGEEMELDPDTTFSGLPLSREPDASSGHSDDSMPALDSHEDTSEDEEPNVGVLAAQYRTGLRATPVPPVHGPQELFLTDEPIAAIISRLKATQVRPAVRVQPPANSLYDALAANFAARRSTASQPSAEPASVVATPRTTLVGSQSLSLIAAVVQATGGVGNIIVQTGLPLLQAVPTWGNLFDCVVHRNGEVAGAFRALASMDAMTIAIANILLPMDAVVGVVTQPHANFRRLGVHQAARSERLRPVPSSDDTRDILVRHRQPLDTPVFIVFLYQENFSAAVQAAATPVLPIVAPSAEANTNPDSTSSLVQAMMARHLSADRDELAQIATQPYGTAYLDILQVKHVLLICRKIGVRLHKPNHTALWNDLFITFRDLNHFLNLRSTFKNACTLYTHTVKAQTKLQAQETSHPGTMSVANALLLQHTNLVLNLAVIEHNPEDPAAQHASQVPRATFLGELRRVL